MNTEHCASATKNCELFDFFFLNPIDCRDKEAAGGENVGPHVLTQVQGLTGLWSHSSATAELGHFSLVN